MARSRPEVTYFPAYEIVTGPQAPFNFFQADRREPSAEAIGAVMRAFLSQCEANSSTDVGERTVPDIKSASASGNKPGTTATDGLVSPLSTLIADAQCEEEAAGL